MKKYTFLLLALLFLLPLVACKGALEGAIVMDGTLGYGGGRPGRGRWPESESGTGI